MESPLRTWLCAVFVGLVSSWLLRRLRRAAAPLSESDSAIYTSGLRRRQGAAIGKRRSACRAGARPPDLPLAPRITWIALQARRRELRRYHRASSPRIPTGPRQKLLRSAPRKRSPPRPTRQLAVLVRRRIRRSLPAASCARRSCGWTHGRTRRCRGARSARPGSTATSAQFEEKFMLQRYHGMLRARGQRARLDRLLWDGQTRRSRRMMPLCRAG